MTKQIADEIITDYLEHYDLPLRPASESHLHDCIMDGIAKAVAVENERCVKAILDLAGTARLKSTWPTPEMCAAAIKE